MQRRIERILQLQQNGGHVATVLDHSVSFFFTTILIG